MSETENQVSVEPASEEKTDTKEVKATKRATEVSIDGANFNKHTLLVCEKYWLSTKKHNAMPIDLLASAMASRAVSESWRFFSFPSPARAHHKNTVFP